MKAKNVTMLHAPRASRHPFPPAQVADVTALLSHAQACNAQQLLAFCVHHCRVNLTLCERTDGWAALGDDLKALVMRRSAEAVETSA